MFIKIANPEQAQRLSEKLYALSRPNPDFEDITTSLIAWKIHPVTEETLLEIPEGLMVFIDLVSDAKMVAELLEPLLEIGKVTAIDVKEMENKVFTSKGGSALLTDILPTSLFENLLSLEELQEDGWFGAKTSAPFGNLG